MRPTLEKLSEDAYQLLQDALQKQGIYVTAIEHRVKTEKSLAGKLELKPFDRLNRRIAAVNQAEIFPVSLMFYLPVFESFGFKTLGDVQRFIDEHSDDAYHLALSQLAVTDYDFFASSIAPQNLCLVYVMKNDGSREALKRLYDMLNGAQDSNGNAADQIMEMAKTLPFMSKKTD